ncbi:sensor histidine kinase [Roseomonas populi]|uniref:histidine kinase n=1 Tax=Roseomonas populi TaxID=3121582 RepID=A0ABT1X4T7_9PROT|nr:HAMP domain-containing sensor histidine kinase [Roseomonas pecuniae]MCR0983122.1 HAMP domain-containing histidine kinase [Roseomonas pecuniae]
MRITSSLSFRSTLLYTVVFGASVALMIFMYFFHNVVGPMQDIKTAVYAEARVLDAVHRSGGADALVAALLARGHSDDGRKAFHSLISASGETLAGNLAHVPPRSNEQWLQIEADTRLDGENDDHTALVYDSQLTGGERLLVGFDIEDLVQRRATLSNAATWLVLGSFPFGLLGGAVMSYVIGQRVDAIGRTARRIMSGHLEERIPIRESGDDFDNLAITLNLMLDRIQQLLDSFRSASDTIAHELRTPLARLHADLSDLRAALPGEAPPQADAAVQEAEKLVALFDSVLRIARIESRGSLAVRRAMDLTQVLSDVAEAFGPASEERCVELGTDIQPGLTIVGDQNLIFQAIGNLVDNATKYARPGGRVDLQAHTTDVGVEIRITDNGPGIPAEQRDMVFERFIRLPQTAAVPGAGLGLSFVRAVASAHGSEITMADAAPGLVVTWTFPMDQHG